MIIRLMPTSTHIYDSNIYVERPFTKVVVYLNSNYPALYNCLIFFSKLSQITALLYNVPPEYSLRNIYVFCLSEKYPTDEAHTYP